MDAGKEKGKKLKRLGLRRREEFKMVTIFDWKEERREVVIVRHFNKRGTRNGKTMKLY